MRNPRPHSVLKYVKPFLKGFVYLILGSLLSQSHMIWWNYLGKTVT